MITALTACTLPTYRKRVERLKRNRFSRLVTSQPFLFVFQAVLNFAAAKDVIMERILEHCAIAALSAQGLIAELSRSANAAGQAAAIKTATGSNSARASTWVRVPPGSLDSGGRVEQDQSASEATGNG